MTWRWRVWCICWLGPFLLCPALASTSISPFGCTPDVALPLEPPSVAALCRKIPSFVRCCAGTGSMGSARLVLTAPMLTVLTSWDCHRRVTVSGWFLWSSLYFLHSFAMLFSATSPCLPKRLHLIWTILRFYRMVWGLKDQILSVSALRLPPRHLVQVLLAGEVPKWTGLPFQPLFGSWWWPLKTSDVSLWLKKGTLRTGGSSWAALHFVHSANLAHERGDFFSPVIWWSSK